MKQVFLSLILLLSFSSFAIGNDLKDFLSRVEGSYSTSGENGCLEAFADIEGNTYNVNITVFKDDLIIENDGHEILAFIDLKKAKLSKSRSGTLDLCEGCSSNEARHVDSSSLSISKNGKILFKRQIMALSRHFTKKCELVKKKKI